MIDPQLDCAAIVLAAGASTRLGQPKQLVPVGGESLLRRTVRLAGESGCSPVFVVLGHDAQALAPEVHGLNSLVVVNENWSTGMASSLKSGLTAALHANPGQDSVLVLVCDQPRLDLKLLQRLWATHTMGDRSITASHYGDTLGVPAIFSRPLFAEILELTGDHGARRILQRYREQAAQVDFPGGDFDLDTAEDLLKLNS